MGVAKKAFFLAEEEFFVEEEEEAVEEAFEGGGGRRRERREAGMGAERGGWVSELISRRKVEEGGGRKRKVEEGGAEERSKVVELTKIKDGSSRLSDEKAFLNSSNALFIREVGGLVEGWFGEVEGEVEGWRCGCSKKEVKVHSS